MQTIFKKRIKRVLSLLKKDHSAMLLSSAPKHMKSRDIDHHFCQDKDFYYLTGLDLPDILLFLSGKLGKGFLFAPPENPITIVWEGARPNLKKIAKNLGLELIVTEAHQKEINARIPGHTDFYFSNRTASLAWNYAQKLMSEQSHLRRNNPKFFKHSDVIIEPLRLYKDQHELKLIKNATSIAYQALNETKALICAGTRERDFAAALNFILQLNDAEEAFSTIAATGKSAATLHYHALERSMKNGELLLLDFGACYQKYSCDVTRMFPVKGYFEGWQSELYEVVLSAHKAALKKVKSGVLIKQVYDAAARELTIGLKELGVLKGKASALFNKQAYKKYFPHGIGHTLGLDIHDVGDLRGNNAAFLKAGMVFTIEPGLYFSKPTGKLPACGVRFEDDILVTQKGYINLTDKFPREIQEVETFLAN